MRIPMIDEKTLRRLYPNQVSPPIVEAPKTMISSPEPETVPAEVTTPVSEEERWYGKPPTKVTVDSTHGDPSQEDRWYKSTPKIAESPSAPNPDKKLSEENEKTALADPNMLDVESALYSSALKPGLSKLEQEIEILPE